MKRGESWKLAGLLALKLGMVPTGANVQTIRLAIESEADYSAMSLDEASQVIAVTALEDRRRGCDVSRFYFEDARWRRREQTREDCPLHPDSGLTPRGTCWGCYAERCSEGMPA